ncbi:MAG: hypothetical protein KDE47_02140 [Caldilineaceae bacterium]|nr:hypothetical protein [Caldilineaceae bacterium]
MLLRHQLFAHLRDLFAQLYVDVPSSRRVVADAGLDERQIKFSERAADNWHEILREAERQRCLPALFALALDNFPEHQPLRTAEQAYQQWQRRGRLSLRRLAVVTTVCLTILLLGLRLPPFHDRPIWSEIGRVPVSESRLLARVGNVLLATISTESNDCDAEDSGIWRSIDQGVTWEAVPNEPLLNRRTDNRCLRAYVTALLHRTTPTQTVIYAATAMLDDSDRNTIGLLHSTDLGLTWTPLGQEDLLRGQNLGYVSFVDQTADDLVVAMVGADQAFAALYRYSAANPLGDGWQKISGVQTCPTGFVNSLPVAWRMFALVEGPDALYAGIGSGLYRSTDRGDCWQKLDQEGTDYSFKAVAPLNGQAGQLLVVTYDRTLIWRNSHDVRLWNIDENRLGKSLSTIAESIDVLQIDEPSQQWFVANSAGMVAKVSYGQTPTWEFLPTITRCNNFIFGCPVAMATDFAGDTPLLLAQGHVYRYQPQGPWWRAVWP